MNSELGIENSENLVGFGPVADFDLDGVAVFGSVSVHGALSRTLLLLTTDNTDGHGWFVTHSFLGKA